MTSSSLHKNIQSEERKQANASSSNGIHRQVSAAVAAALQAFLLQKQRWPSPGRDSFMQTRDTGICRFRLVEHVRTYWFGPTNHMQNANLVTIYGNIYILVELAVRSGIVMDYHATALGSIPGRNGVKPCFTSFARECKWGCSLFGSRGNVLQLMIWRKPTINRYGFKKCIMLLKIIQACTCLYNMHFYMLAITYEFLFHLNFT